MKKILLALVISFSVTGFYSCTKTEDTTKDICDNNIKDGKETEIDCGGTCSPCPAPSTFTATLTGGTTVGGEQHLNSHGSYGQILGPSIRISSSNTSDRLLFMFIPGPIGQPNWVSSVSFNYQGEPYTHDDEDTAGIVIVTAQDTLRKIISGTFNFKAERINKGIDKCQVHDGVFTNVRYYEL